MSPYRYLILLILPLSVVAGYLAEGYFNFLTPFLCFVFLPLIDLLPYNKKLKALSTVHDNKAFALIPFLFVPVVLMLVFGGSIIVAEKPLPLHAFVGFMISVGTVTGSIGFALAHEFIHKFTIAQKAAGYSLLSCANYLHYSIEHVHGHHVYACTSKDPNSAIKGESLYKFLVRSIPGSFINAWKIELRLLRKNNFAFFSIHNRMLLFLLVQLLILIVLSAFGTKALLFFAGQSFVAVFLHQQVNYLQHYGLVRNKKGDMHERMHAHHAWSIPESCRIVDLFQVQNHADHHLHAATPYEKLNVLDESPQLPANYATMMLVTLVPPLWFKIIHNRLPKTQTTN
jgi:alkane 1-monooxygenase